MRLHVEYRLAGACDILQIDVGVGDAITPKAILVDYPSLLGLPGPQIQAYPQEAVAAEKFQAMVILGIANSRLKDFYDLYLLTEQFEFEGRTLAEAVVATFDRRKTDLPTQTPLALTSEFAGNPAKRLQWHGFLKRSRMEESAPDMERVVERLAAFMMPVVHSLITGGSPQVIGLQVVHGGAWHLQPGKRDGFFTLFVRRVCPLLFGVIFFFVFRYLLIGLRIFDE